MGNEANPFSYTMAIFNCVVVAILTFFFPLGMESKFWSIIVIGILVLFSNLLYLKREELAADNQRSFVGTFALVLSYVVVITSAALPVVIAAGQNATTTLGLTGDDAETMVRFTNAYVYFVLFALHMQSAAIGMLAEEQGRRASFVTLSSMAFSFVCFGLYYINFFEVLGEGVLLPSWTQTIGFLLLVPGLLRLRKLESYGHI